MTTINKNFKVAPLVKIIKSATFNFIEFHDDHAYFPDGIIIVKADIQEVFNYISDKDIKKLNGKAIRAIDIKTITGHDLKIETDGISCNDCDIRVSFIDKRSIIRETFDNIMKGEPDNSDFTFRLKEISLLHDILGNRKITIDIINKRFVHGVEGDNFFEFVIGNIQKHDKRRSI